MPLTLNPDTNTPKLKSVDFNPFAGPKLLKATPTTPSQVELWLACVIGGDDANRSYNESVSLNLKGELSQSAIASALEQLIARHEILRSTFSSDGKSLCIHETSSIDLELIDISDLPFLDQERHIEKVHLQDAEKAFDLMNGPLFRSYLIRLSEGSHILKLSAHHIICDGWSFGILLENISKIYNSIVNKEPIHLDPVTQFSQYAKELEEFLSTEESRATEEYWLNQFTPEVPILDLPTDNPRPTTRTYKSNREDFVVPKDLIEKVKKMGARSGASLVSTLLTAFETYLHLITGQDTIVLGIPAAGQNATGHYELVGHCVNLLPVKSRPKGKQAFSEYLSQRKSQILDAYDHQQFTFGTLLQKLNVARDSSRIPLVPVIFNIDMGMDANVTFSGLKHSLSSIPRSFENFEIFLNITGTEQTLTFEWSYNSFLFKEETIVRMMDDFQLLLDQVISDPDIRIRDIALPSHNKNKPSEKNLTQIEIWNTSTKSAYPKDKIVTEFISESARKYPAKTAVYFRGAEMSYEELERKSNQFANLLIEKGVEKGAIVGLMVDRSFEMVVSLLAIIKSGAAYLPLDPQYPEGRLSYMLADSGATHLIISEAHADFPAQCEAIVIEEALQGLKNHSSAKPNIDVSGADLAYVLYTSGSTGKPKGVQIEHHSLTNFLISVEKRPGMDHLDTILAIATISFDIAVTELLLPLLSGASIYLVDSNTAKDGRKLLKLVEDKNITIMQATPTTWRMMIAAGWEKKLPLKIICTGEAFPRDLAKELLNRGAEVWNGYGPTETTIWSSLKQMDLNDDQITIGFPLNNTRLFVLDDSLNPVDLGTTGEICIAGDGLAKGYLGLPDLTLEKFVTCNFSGDVEKIYRTGDLGYQLKNGEFVCLGRSDEQVKIRGQRIELSEIEFALSQQDDIKEAVVSVQQLGDNHRLIAHIVPSEGKLAEWHHLWDEIYNQGIEKEKNLSLEEQDLDIAIVTNDEVDGVVHGAEWKSESLKRLKALKSNSILELGSGGGHIMFGLAPSVTRYVATDYSEVAINKLKEKLLLDPEKWGHVEAFAAAADDFRKINSSFDLVLLHSVIQYFPNLHYLFDVIKKSVEALNDDGCIFIGDSQTDESAYMHIASEQLKYVSDQATISDFKKIIDYRIQQQNELSVDPDFFYFLPMLIPAITSVDIQIRGGENLNETTKSHYDVWLYKGASAPRILESEVVHKWREVNTIENLRNILKYNSGRVVQITQIPNKRIDHDFAIVDTIRSMEDDAGIVNLKAYINRNTRTSSVNPTELWETAQMNGFKAHVRWANDGADGQVEVVFLPINENVYIPSPPSRIRCKTEDEYFSRNISPFEVLEITQQQIEGWKSSLRSVLPEHMIPATYMALTQLPTTTNGKIDRKSLPEPTHSKTTNDEHYIAPKTEVEKAVAKIWREYLGIEKISSKSNFFELGGHSLTAVRVMLAIEKRFGKKLAISTLFENSTVESLAKLITGEKEKSKWNSLVPIRPKGTKPAVYLVHGWGLNVLTFEPFIKYMDEEQPIYALQGLGLGDDTKLLYTIEEIAKFYISEILENDPVGPYALGGYSAGGIIAFEMARQLIAINKKVTAVAILDTYVGNENPVNNTIIKKTKKQLCKLLFIGKNLVKFPRETLEYQIDYLKRITNYYEIIKAEPQRQEISESYEIAYNNYVMSPLNIKVDLFRTKKRLYFLHEAKNYGWKRFAKNGVTAHEIEGDHLTCLKYPHVQQLAQKLQSVLDKNAQGA